MDPALVHHYFGTKEQVFAAAIEVSFEPALVVPAVLGGGPGRRRRAAGPLLPRRLGEPGHPAPLLAVLRSALTNEAAATVLRGLVAAAAAGAGSPADLDVPDADVPRRAGRLPA